MLLSEFRAAHLNKETGEAHTVRCSESLSPKTASNYENNVDIIKSTVTNVIAKYKNELEKYQYSLEDYVLIQRLNIVLNEFSQILKEPSETENEASVTSNVFGKKVVNNSYADEKYRYLTEYGTQILCLLNASGDCSYVSRNFERITNHAISKVHGAEFIKIIHNDFRDRLHGALHSYSSMPEDAKPQILRLKMQHNDEKYYWYQFTIHHKQEHYICLIENIHEHMQTQSTLQKARLEAELALRSRSEFLANMSHELRTPLNAVIGFSQIMEKGVFGEINNPQYASYIKHIQESGHDLLAKIEDLLEIANVDAGRVTLECEEVYINDLVKHVIKTQSHHAQTAKVELSYIPKGNILLFIDRLKIQHVLGHLVANAIKFNHAGGEVTLEIGREGKSELRLSIHDNGVGINDLKCHDIREALQQDNCWTAKNNHHIGIGLALTKEFVALHGGKVEITSSNGIGTTVSIILPRECIRMAPNKKTQDIKELDLHVN